MGSEVVTKLKGIEVECSTHCNWRCVYCPVSQDPKPPRSMDIELFKHILKKAVAHQSIEIVSINAYCEPSIDKGFEERLHAIANTPLRLNLYTNGTGITLDHIKLLQQTRILHAIIFNFPSLDKARHAALTQSHFYDKSREAIDLCLKYQLTVGLSVQGTTEEIQENFPGIFAWYGDKLQFEPQHNIMALRGLSSDRCGVLKNDRYYLGVHLNRPLIPCPVPESWVYLNVDGDLFLCCEDYYQTTKYANIRDGSIEELMQRRVALLPENCKEDSICHRCSLMAKLLHKKGTQLNVIQ